MSKDNGGPAFPRNGVRLLMPASLSNHPDIEKIEFCQDGLSLRDYFAAKAMQAIISTNRDVNPVDFVGSADKSNAEIIAENAYFMADAMIQERSK